VRIVLVGPPGVGKSVTGRALAARLGLAHVDTDQLLAQRAGRACAAEVLREEGEAAFRAREAEVVRNLPDDVVVSTGGGTLSAPGAWPALEAMGARVIALEAPVSLLAARIRRRPGSRPLLDGAESLEDALRALLAKRAPLYARAEVRLRALVQPQRMAQDIARYLAAAERPREPVGEGTLRYLRGLVPGRAVLVTEPVVDALHGTTVRRALGHALRGTIRLPSGEAAKRMDVVMRAARQLLRRGADRETVLVVVGGGALSDAAGLLAALYMRGIPWVSVPTTLLAMVDASLGGKVAVDLPEGKNLVGAFYPPVATVVDTSLLATLPPEGWREGLAETVKAAVIGDDALLETLRAGPVPKTGPALAEWVRAARRIKAEIVGQDPKERPGHVREYLNLGHTLAHALEQASGYRLSHGTAVALGTAAMVRMAALGGELDGATAARILEALRVQDLPLTLADVPGRAALGLRLAAIMAAFSHDKKARQGRVRIVVPHGVGHMEVRPATDGELEQLARLAGVGGIAESDGRVRAEGPSDPAQGVRRRRRRGRPAGTVHPTPAQPQGAP